MPKNKITLINENAYLPTRQTKYSIGHDLYSSVDIVIPSHTTVKVDLGIKIDFYKNEITGEVYYGQIVSRSSLSIKGINVIAGLIDPDYNGPLHVVMFNNSNNIYTIKKGDRIAQLILLKYNLFESSLYDSSGNFIESKQVIRVDGFGSTGK
ncbi:dUTPase [uncultured bacterium]|nr:dUTPase [uncultured bacterium]